MDSTQETETTVLLSKFNDGSPSVYWDFSEPRDHALVTHLTSTRREVPYELLYKRCICNPKLVTVACQEFQVIR